MKNGNKGRGYMKSSKGDIMNTIQSKMLLTGVSLFASLAGAQVPLKQKIKDGVETVEKKISAGMSQVYNAFRSKDQAVCDDITLDIQKGFVVVQIPIEAVAELPAMYPIEKTGHGEYYLTITLKSGRCVIKESGFSIECHENKADDHEKMFADVYIERSFPAVDLLSTRNTIKRSARHLTLTLVRKELHTIKRTIAVEDTRLIK
jgi:hypothetical protein